MDPLKMYFLLFSHEHGDIPFAVLVYQRGKPDCFAFSKVQEDGPGHVEIYYMDLNSRSNISVLKKIKQTILFLQPSFPSCFPSLVDNFVAGNKLS